MANKLYNIKNNLTATTNPQITNDSSQFYGEGSLWFNVTNGLYYTCIDDTVGAAQWRLITNSINTTTTATPVTNTTVETDFINYSIPANTLSSGRIIRIGGFGTYLNNSGLNRTIRLRGYFGATLIFDTGVSGNYTTNATARSWKLDVQGSITGAATQVWNARFSSTLLWTATPTANMNGTSALAVNVAQVFRVTVTHSAAAATISYIKHGHTVEIL